MLLVPNHGALAVGLAFTFATIATFGADTLVVVAGLVGAAVSAVIQFFAEGRKDNREKEKRDAIDKAG